MSKMMIIMMMTMMTMLMDGWMITKRANRVREKKRGRRKRKYETDKTQQSRTEAMRKNKQAAKTT